MGIEKLRKLSYQTRTHCLICGNKLDKPLIELPGFPLTEIYTTKLMKERVGFADQNFHFCSNCGHGQVANVIDIKVQYGNAPFYYFRASESATGRRSADYFVDFLNHVAGNRNFGNIIEIGCNDLYILKALKSKAKRLIGIDPILKGKEKGLTKDNIVAIGDFFENVVLEGEIDLVICKDTLEHVSNPKQVVEKIVDRSHEQTIFFFQFPILETLLSSYRFDQIFHQHLNYFSFKSINYMLNELGCELLDYKINFDHWGAIIIAFKKGKGKLRYAKGALGISGPKILERYEIFKNAMDVTKRQLSFLKGELIYGYGAALMLPVLSYHLKNDLSCLKCIIDDDENKKGLYYINLSVPIKTVEAITDIKDSVVLVTAIASLNNVRSILTKLFALSPKQIILPLNNIA